MSQNHNAGLTGRRMRSGLTVNDLDKSIRFYQALGFEIEERWEREGKLGGVMLRGGDVQVAIGQDDWKKGKDRAKGVGTRFWIMTTQDLGALAERAREAGDPEARSYEAWGRQLLDLTDPDGFAYTFSNEA